MPALRGVEKVLPVLDPLLSRPRLIRNPAVGGAHDLRLGKVLGSTSCASRPDPVPLRGRSSGRVRRSVQHRDPTGNMITESTDFPASTLSIVVCDRLLNARPGSRIFAKN